ncbi:MAG: hypothetical protein LQ340_000039 [Diploschistes diacapsis]|nr:MAG: hypothetical protein LQ340_000039 [Diploschistes diacapsis]
MSIVTSGPVDNVAFCDTSTIGTTQLISIPGPYVTDNSSTVTITKATLYGPLVQINFKATDISSLTPPMITTSKSAQPASATGGGYGSNSTAVTDQSGDSGLSTGAKIGIGVGVPLGVLLLAAIAAFFFLRRRKSKQGPVPIQRPLGDPSKANSPGGQGLHGQGAHAPHGKWQNMSEAPAGRPENIELDGRNMPSEAPPAELPADGPGYR